VCDIIREFNRTHSFKSFMWSYFVVSTRGLTYKNRDGRIVPTLVPVIDLMDHSRTPNVRVTFDQSKYSFIVIAARSISRGEELTHTYEEISESSHLFKKYGFIDENAHDVQVIQFTQVNRYHTSMD
jgi:hypothetical protein